MNSELSRQYEEVLKHKELQHRDINDHKESQLEIEKRIRGEHEN